MPLLLVLDGVTDPAQPGRLPAGGRRCRRRCRDSPPKDHAVGINATVAKVASGAAETVPYFMVTNLSRTLGELKEREHLVPGH
jgi:23S rRNA (guanosine2251-2'-O)-methyltransferase